MAPLSPSHAETTLEPKSMGSHKFTFSLRWLTTWDRTLCGPLTSGFFSTAQCLQACPRVSKSQSLVPFPSRVTGRSMDTQCLVHPMIVLELCPFFPVRDNSAMNIHGHNFSFSCILTRNRTAESRGNTFNHLKTSTFPVYSSLYTPCILDFQCSHIIANGHCLPLVKTPLLGGAYLNVLWLIFLVVEDNIRLLLS